MNYAHVSVSERRFLPPAVAVSTVAFALRPPRGSRIHDSGDGFVETIVGADSGTLWIPLVRRTRPPFAECWALPGGPIPWNETLVDTALRTLREAVRHAPGYLEQLYSFGAVERSAEAQRLVTIAYWALYGEAEAGDRGDTWARRRPRELSAPGTCARQPRRHRRNVGRRAPSARPAVPFSRRGRQ